MLRYWEQLDLLKELVNKFVDDNSDIIDKYQICINGGNIDILLYRATNEYNEELIDKISDFELYCVNDTIDLCMLHIMLHDIPAYITDPYYFLGLRNNL